MPAVETLVTHINTRSGLREQLPTTPVLRIALSARPVNADETAFDYFSLPLRVPSR